MSDQTTQTPSEAPAATAADATLLTEGAAPAAADTVPAADASAEGDTLLTGGAEKKPDEGEGEKQPDEGEGEKKPEGAPEAYEDFTVAEGVELDAGFLDEFKAQAKADNLPQDVAQKYVDLGVKLVAERNKQFEDLIVTTRQEWIDAAKADKEFGGDKLDVSLGTARRALDAYGSPELSALLNETGLGNHPEIIRLLVKAGAAVSEDRIDNGREPSAKTATSLAARLYPAHANA